MLVLDGAYGTFLRDNYKIKYPVALENLFHPERVRKLHKLYEEKGADIISTNSCFLNDIMAKENNTTLEKLVEATIDCIEDITKIKAYVAGPIYPVYKNLSKNELFYQYEKIFSLIPREKIDLILLETFTSPEEAEIAYKSASKYFDKIAVSFHISEKMQTIAGDTIADIIKQFEKKNLYAIGANCFLPYYLPEIVKFFSKSSHKKIFFPNAGIKNTIQKDEFLDEIKKANFEHIDIIGSCCKSTPEYTELIKKFVSA